MGAEASEEPGMMIRFWLSEEVEWRSQFLGGGPGVGGGGDDRVDCSILELEGSAWELVPKV